MKLSIEQVKKMDVNYLYSYLFSIIDEMYSKFSYLSLDKNEYNNIIIAIIEKSKLEYDGKQTYVNYITASFENALINKGKELMHDNSIKIISNYINIYFNNGDYTNNFHKLDMFFKQMNYFPEDYEILEIIEQNSLISKTIEFILEKNDLDNKTYSHSLLAFVEVYCEVNNIDKSSLKNLEENTSFYSSDMSNYPLLNQEDERKLLERAQKGDEEAKELLIKSNFRLVSSIARCYLNRGLSYDDLFQEGSLGLIYAIEHFDLSSFNRLSTYSVYWIKQKMVRATRNMGRNIRLPSEYYQKLNEFHRAKNNLCQKLFREPTIDELASELKISKEKVVNLYNNQMDTISINGFVGDDDNTEIGSFIPANVSVEDEVLKNDLQNSVSQILEDSELSETEKNVIVLRFCLGKTRELALREVGNILHLSYERIRMVEKTALQKLRYNEKLGDLADYVFSFDEALKIRRNYQKHFTALKNYGKEKENTKMRKLKSIYEFLNNYSKDQINYVITLLTEEDQKLLKKRYGDDLEHPKQTIISNANRSRFYGYLIPKIENLLQKMYLGTISTVDEKKFGVELSHELDSSDSEKPMDDMSPLTSVDTNNQKNINTQQEEIDKDNYVRILEMLKTPSFNEMVNTLSPKKAVILSLRLGYVDNKYFSTEAIANFLGITNEEVREITKEALLLYRDSFNSFIDQATRVVTDKIKIKE